jgi:hypothetical protein
MAAPDGRTAARGTPPPLELNVAEGVGVADTPGGVPPANSGVDEGLFVGAAVSFSLSPEHSQDEFVGVDDRVQLAVPAEMTLAEVAHVSELAEVVLSPVLTAREGVAVGDAVSLEVNTGPPPRG